MASGSHFGVPHLDGVPGEYRFHAGEEASIRLARTLLRLDIADPADWPRARRDPTEYVQATLNRFIELHGGTVIRRRFNLTLTLSESADEYAETAEQDPDGRRLYLIVNPDSAAYVVTGPTLALLERENPRLPVTFYQVFAGALTTWLRTYDYRDAEERVEMLREWAEAEGEPYEIADVAASLPASMKRRPLRLETLRRLGGRARNSEVRAVIAATLELHRASETARRPKLTDEVGEQLADCNPPLPSVLVVFAESDGVEYQFDDDSQNMLECTPEPNLIIPLNAFDAGSVQSAFATLATVCETVSAACRLIDLMPGNEKWVTAGEVQHGSSSGDRG